MNKRRGLCKRQSAKTIMAMAVLSCLYFSSADAYAACTSPAAVAGEMIYNTDLNVPQYCDGTNWNSMFKSLVGNTCSGTADCMNIGDQCADTTIFVGCNPSTYARMYLHPNNQSTSVQFSTLGNDTGADDRIDGGVNYAAILGIIASYPAFGLCKTLNDANALGHNDWYLPSRWEMYYFFLNVTAINAGPGDDFAATTYWTSTEVNGTNANAWYQDLSTGAQVGTGKVNTHYARCMRKN